MRAQLVILGALVSICAAQQPACHAGDDVCDDPAALLQGSVGVNHGGNHHAKSAEEGSESWPDFKKAFDTVKNAIGGVDKLEKDFDGVKTAAKQFLADVHGSVTSLLADVRPVGDSPSMGIDAIRGKVVEFYNSIHDAAHKLFEALKKVTMTWVNGIGKVVPSALKAPMNSLLAKVSDQGKLFTDSFHTAAEDLKKITNATAICSKVKLSLHTVLTKASHFAKSATGLSTNGLSPEIKAARDALPDVLKKEIEKMLKKANAAADRILHKLTAGMKEITHGVAKVFEDHCHGLPKSGATQLQVGALMAIVLSVLPFSM